MKDDRIRCVGTERQALVESRVRAAVITNANLPASEMAERIIRALTDLAAIFREREGPFCSRCSRTVSTSKSLVKHRRLEHNSRRWSPGPVGLRGGRESGEPPHRATQRPDPQRSVPPRP